MADGYLVFQTAIDESGFNEGTKKVDKSAQSALADIGKKAAGVVGAMKVADIAKDAAQAVVSNADEMKKAMNQFAAATGTGAAELSGYQDVMEGIYKNNYGESFEDIGNAMAAITQQMGKMDGSELQGLAESAFALRDTFGYEIEESVRAGKAMMDQFGISGEKAMNLIVNGAQNGLDYSGELIDSINEYSVQFAKVGLSADDMFSIFQAGADSGAWNLDKIGDAVKEFSVRAIDGSNTTVEGFEAIGMNADEMAAKFASGGEGAREAFQQVVQGLAGMEDPVAQSIAGVNLFGTMWEDLGPEVVEQLANIGDEAYGSSHALEELKEVRYDDVASSVATLGRTVISKFLDPIADKALPAVKDAVDGITEALDPPKTMLEEFVDEIEASNKAVKATIGHAQGLMDNAAGEAAKVEAYKKTLLDLNGVTEKTEFQKYQMQTIVSELSGNIPELAAAFDEETASLSLNNDEIASYLDNHENLLMHQAAIEAQTEAYNALFEAKLNQVKADGAVQEAQNKLNVAMRDNNLSQEELTTGGGKYIAEVTEAEEELREAKKAQEESAEAIKNAQSVYDSTEKAIKSTTEALGGEEAAAELTAEANRQNAQSGEDAAGSAGVQEDALESLKQKYSEFHEQLEQDIQNKVSLFDTFDGGEDMSVETMLENLRKQKEGLENWKANMETLAGEVGTTITPEFYNAILEMGPEAANAVQHMVATLDQSNGRELLAQLAQDWGYNLDFSGPASESLSNTGKMVESGLTGVLNIARSAGVSIPEDLASGITSGTMDLNTAADSLGNELSKGMGQLTQMAEEAGVQVPAEITEGLEQGGQAAVDAAQSLINLIAGQSGEMGEAGSENGEALNQGTEEGLKNSSGEVIDAASDVGGEAGTAMQESEASGIEQNASRVNSAVDSTMRGAEGTANSHYSNFFSVGKNMMEGVVSGIVAGSPAVERAARDAVQGAVDGAKDKLEIASPSKVFKKEVGIWIPEGMAVGIEEGTKEVEESARDMADASLKATKDELEIHSPSDVFRKEVGKQIVAGITKGIKKEQEKLNETMKQLSAGAVDASKGALGKYSDVGAEIMDSITEGMQKRQDRLSAKLEKLIDKKVEKVSNGKKVSGFEKQAEKYGKKKSKKSQKKAEKYAKKAKQYREAFAEIGEELTNAMNQGISEEFDKIRSETEEVLSEISDRYQALYDEIKSKQEDMFGKMANPANLYDLDTQLIQIDRYQKGLEKLKDRLPGNETGESLMEQVLGMDVSEADSFMDYLNSLTDTQLAAYLEKWGKIQGQAKEYSERFFKQDFEDAQKAYEGEIAKAMADAEAKMKNVGRNIGEGLLDGLKESMDDMPKEVRKMAKKLVKNFRKAFDINSPSRVMKKEVGRYLPPGISEGFLQALPKAERKISDGVLRAIDDLQGRVLGLQCMPAAPFLSMPAQPSVTVKNSQPVQVQAEIHTTVDLDGRTVGRVVTPYVNQNLGDIQKREERGS